MSSRYTSAQLIALVTLRLLIGWHLLYEGIVKLLLPNWSSAEFLSESKWIMSGIANWIISNDTVLKLVDIMNIFGLIVIGFGLIVGLFARQASIGGALLLFIYYINNAPLIGLGYSIPSEGNYLLVSKTLVEAAALIILALFPTSSEVGLDIYIDDMREFVHEKKNKLTKFY